MLLTTSCNNDDEDNNPEPAFTFDCTYMKVKEGSKFTYKLESFGSTAAQTIESEVIEQSEIDNTLVAVFESNGGQQSFVSCEGDKFIITAPETTMVDGVVTTTTDILITLDMGRTVGESYTAANLTSNSTVQGYSFQTFNRYVGEVIEKDITMEVEGTTYNDVVHFKLETYTSTSADPTFEIFTTSTNYYLAPEVATIMAEIKDETQGIILSTTSLTDYEY